MAFRDVSESITHLSDAIVACGVLPLLGKINKPEWDSRPRAADLLECYACFTRDEAGFVAAERTILREMGLTRVTTAEWWARMVVAVGEAAPNEAMLVEVADLHLRLRFVADTLPNLVPSAPNVREDYGTTALRVVLPFQDTTPSHPMRLSCAIEAVCSLWRVVCAEDGVRAPLSLVACEPGSDIAITFCGASPQVAAFKALVIQVWHGMADSRSAGWHDPRPTGPTTMDATARKADLENGSRLFLEAGAWIPEMSDPDTWPPPRRAGVGQGVRDALPAAPAGCGPAPAQSTAMFHSGGSNIHHMLPPAGAGGIVTVAAGTRGR